MLQQHTSSRSRAGDPGSSRSSCTSGCSAPSLPSGKCRLCSGSQHSTVYLRCKAPLACRMRHCCASSTFLSSFGGPRSSHDLQQRDETVSSRALALIQCTASASDSVHCTAPSLSISCSKYITRSNTHTMHCCRTQLNKSSCSSCTHQSSRIRACLHTGWARRLAPEACTRSGRPRSLCRWAGRRSQNSRGLCRMACSSTRAARTGAAGKENATQGSSIWVIF
jgi:hypothetical protein